MSADLPEHSSSAAARILAAAGGLLLHRGGKGVTIADVAAKAHVGKGTVYLYWKSKEDLLLGLISRDFITLADDVTAAVTADRALARPSRLCVNILRTTDEHPFVSALQRSDWGTARCPGRRPPRRGAARHPRTVRRDAQDPAHLAAQRPCQD